MATIRSSQGTQSVSFVVFPRTGLAPPRRALDGDDGSATRGATSSDSPSPGIASAASTAASFSAAATGGLNGTFEPSAFARSHLRNAQGEFFASASAGYTDPISGFHIEGGVSDPVTLRMSSERTKGVTPAPMIHFDSSRAGPATVSNNPTDSSAAPPGAFIVPFFGKTLEGVDPVMEPDETLNGAAHLSGVGDGEIVRFRPGLVGYMGDSDAEGRPWSFVRTNGSTGEVGVWLNSKGLDGNFGLTTVTPGVQLAEPITPWANPKAAISLSWDQRLTTAESDDLTQVVPYVVAYLELVNPRTGQKLWYGATIFDPRGDDIPHTLAAFDAGTQLGLFTAKLRPGAPAVSLGAGSSTFQRVPWTNMEAPSPETRHFDFVLTRANLRAGLSEYNVFARSKGLPEWPTDEASLAALQVDFAAFNPEIYDASNRQRTPDVNGRMGTSFGNIVLATRALRPKPRRESEER